MIRSAYLFLLQAMAPNALKQITQTSYQSVFFNTNDCEFTVSQVHRFLTHLLYQHPLCLPNNKLSHGG